MESEGSFEDLNLNTWITNHLKSLGFKKPSPIQYNCIPPILEGRDCFGCSKTGSGKTAAFALPILQKLCEDQYGIFCLVLTPTRELAIQISEQFTLFGKPINCRVSYVVGGMDMNTQAAELKRQPHIVVATPGRLADLIRSSDDNVNLKKIKFLVLDEADRLLDHLEGDFADDLAVIFESLPEKRQALLFSATLTDTLKEVKEVSKKQPYFYESKDIVATVDQLDQRFILIPEDVRECYLIHICKELLEKNSKSSIIIFTKTCRNCQVLGLMFQKAGFPCVMLHSVMKQHRRFDALNKFKSSNIKLMVATDVAARGLDIPAVQVVINHNIPGSSKTYVHRVGRTARAGRSGMAISLVTQLDLHRIQAIEEHINKKLEEFKVDEDAVHKLLTKVSMLKRQAEISMESNNFGEKKKINQRKAILAEGKNPEEEAKKQRKAKAARVRAERKMRKRMLKKNKEEE